MALFRYDAVFRGRAIATRLANPEDSDPLRAEIVTEFRVLETYKGILEPVVAVSSRTCRYPFDLAVEYLVWARRDAHRFVTSACDRNSRWSSVQFGVDLRLLNDPKLMPELPCGQLNDAGVRALRAYTDAVFTERFDATPQAIEWADNELASQRDAATECLERIVRRGLGGTGIWRGRSAPPNNGEWALPVLSRVNASAAIPFWRTRRNRLSEFPWDRITIDLQLVHLGDRSAISSVIGFLHNPPDLTMREDAFAAVSLQAIKELARVGYGPAHQLLQNFEKRGIVPADLYDVYSAWLRRDTERLQSLTRNPKTADEANEALSEIRRGASD